MKVSVVIPCYNVEDYIAECLDSVYAQTYSDLEVIAVDNQSTDQTLSVLHHYQKERQQDLIILEEEKPGAPATRNRGLREATGEWIQFLDADDLLKPFKIEHQVKTLGADRNAISFVAAASTKLLVNGLEVHNRVPENDSVWLTLFLGKLGNTCANLWNRTYLEKVGGWNIEQSSSQETELMFRLLQSEGKVLFDNEPLTIIQERTTGQISDKQLPGKLRFMELRLKMLAYLKAEHPQVYLQYYHQMYGKLYDVCFMISSFDISKGAEYYKMLPPELRLPMTLKGRGYQQLIRLFGFERLERIRQKLFN